MTILFMVAAAAIPVPIVRLLMGLGSITMIGVIAYGVWELNRINQALTELTRRRPEAVWAGESHR